VAAVQYTAGILDWTVDELKDRKTKNLMSINYRVLHPRADVDRLYVSRRKGSKEMVSIEQSVKIE